MEREKAIVFLKQWVSADRLMRGEPLKSDYDKFCEERNVAIDTILAEYAEVCRENAEFCKELEEKQKQIEYLVNERKQMEEKLFESTENYVHKDKIREKIEELEKQCKPIQEKEWTSVDDDWILHNNDKKIKVLKELLGGDMA